MSVSLASPGTRSAVLAGAVGNVMAWYDFGIYGYFAIVIGRQFFPSGDPVASLLAAFAVFASGFLVRPLGGVIFGHYGDRLGRRKVLAASVMLSGLFGGAMPAAMAEMFPTRVRYSALALGYNTVESTVGGTAPLIGTWLVATTHNSLAPSWYLILAAAITLVVVLQCRETYREPLR